MLENLEAMLKRVVLFSAFAVFAGVAQNVGIGEPNPSARLDITVPAGWTNPVLRAREGTTTYFIITGTGNVGINTAAPARRLHVQGDVRITNVPAAVNPSKVLVVNSLGDVQGIVFPGDSTQVLRGDGTFGWGAGDHDWHNPTTSAPPTSIDANIYTNGSVAINSTFYSSSWLYVRRNPSDTTGAGLSTIYGYRSGKSGATNGGSGWGVYSVDAAIKGYSLWGNQYSAAIAGYSFMDYDNSAAVVGGRYSGSPIGFLGYRDTLTFSSGDIGKVNLWAGYFVGPVAIYQPAIAELSRRCLMWVEDSIVNFGGCEYWTHWGNGDTVGGVVVRYVADFDIGEMDGTAVGIGSIEYFLDGIARTHFNDDLVTTTNGTIDLGFSSSSYYWQDVFAVNFITASDRDLKKNIQPLNYGLKEVLQLKPVRYQMKEGIDTVSWYLGLVAEDVYEVIPEVVKVGDYKKSEEDLQYHWVEFEHWGIDYTKLVPVLIKAIQEQQQIIERLETELEELRKQVADLQQE